MNHLLIILAGNTDQKTVPLSNGRYTIGRGDQAHIQIFSHQISRIHAELIIENDQATLLDRGSANGTAINGKFISTGHLKDGDKIMLGEVVIEYRNLDQNDKASTIRPESFSPRPSAYLAATKVIADKLRPRSLWPLLTSVFGIAFLSIAILSGMSYKNLIETKLKDESLQRAHELVRYLAEKNREDLRLNNELLLDVDTVLREKGVKQAFIINSKGRIAAPVSKMNQLDNHPFTLDALAQVSDQKIMPAFNANAQTYTFVHPIRTYNDKMGTYETIGVAKIVFSAKDAIGSLPEMTRLLTLLTLSAIGLALFLGWLLTKTLANPANKLAEKIHQWRSGHLPTKTQAPFKDFEPLYDAIQRAMEESEDK
ncbi:MAG: FHA domain-containing protein [Bdellovibrionales bacterium]|nr:FHA domain-containing protein [Bdellovibrionales bacterium]